jgi:hypothetical protein
MPCDTFAPGRLNRSTKLDHHFADVLALEETDESTHRLLDTLDDGFFCF